MQVLSADSRVTIDISYKNGIAHALSLEWIHPDQKVEQVADYLRQGAAHWYVEGTALKLVCGELGVEYCWHLSPVEARGVELGLVGIDHTEFEVKHRERLIWIH